MDFLFLECLCLISKFVSSSLEISRIWNFTFCIDYFRQGGVKNWLSPLYYINTTLKPTKNPYHISIPFKTPPKNSTHLPMPSNDKSISLFTIYKYSKVEACQCSRLRPSILGVNRRPQRLRQLSTPYRFIVPERLKLAYPRRKSMGSFGEERKGFDGWVRAG